MFTGRNERKAKTGLFSRPEVLNITDPSLRDTRSPSQASLDSAEKQDLQKGSQTALSRVKGFPFSTADLS